MRKDRWWRLWSKRDGIGAVEFAFIAPLLLTLLLGIIDFGMGYWREMQIANAADAGAQWAVSNPPFSANNVKTVASNATNLSTLNTTAVATCGCPTSTGVAQYSCTATCPDSTSPSQYIFVTTRMCYSTLFNWPGLSYCSTNNSLCQGCGSNQILLSAQSVVAN